MNHVFYLGCLICFFLLPFAVLTTRATRPERLPWWVALLAVAAIGWLFVNGAVFFHYNHLGDLMRSYGENPPADLVEHLISDGPKRVIALYFGWAYALIYFVPLAIIYRSVPSIRRLHARTRSA